MSITQQVQTIRHGLFADGYAPHEMRQILDNGTQQVVNWGRIRPAVVTLNRMPWCNLDSQWEYFLDEGRYPIGRTMDLRPDEVGIFQDLVHNLVSQTSEPMRILMSVHPEISLNDVSVAIDATDLETLEKAIGHVKRTARLAAIGDEVKISSIQPGSVEVFLTAGAATVLALELAILLAKAWKDPQIRSDVRRLVRHLKRENDDAVDEQKALETVLEETRETFWETAIEPLQNAAIDHGLHTPEAQNKINAAAKEIYDNAEEASADWRLPPAVISGLPNGLTVALYDSPEAIGRVIKELAAPSDPD